MRRTELSEDQIDKAKRLLRDGAGFRAMARTLHITEAVARRIRDELNAAEGRVPNPKNLSSLRAEPMQRQISEIAQDAIKRIARLKRAADREIVWSPPEPDRPVAIAFLADLHYGDTGVDYDACELDIQTILDTPGMFCVVGGDLIDNHIRHLAATLAAAMPPALQWRWLAEMLERLRPKLVAVVGGNHEAWAAAVSGYDPLEWIAEKLTVPYDAHEASIRVKMRGVEYRLSVRHRYRFNSQFNPEHSVRRLWELGDEDFDVGVVCDKHVATVAPFVRHRLERWVLRPGTYQTASRYARQGGWHGAQPVTPAVVLMPGVRDLHGFSRLDWARLVVDRAAETRVRARA